MKSFGNWFINHYGLVMIILYTLIWQFVSFESAIITGMGVLTTMTTKTFLGNEDKEK